MSRTSPMELLPPGRFERAAAPYGLQLPAGVLRAGGRPSAATDRFDHLSTPHVGLTNRYTLRPGFADAGRASREEGYPGLPGAPPELGLGSDGLTLALARGKEHLLRA